MCVCACVCVCVSYLIENFHRPNPFHPGRNPGLLDQESDQSFEDQELPVLIDFHHQLVGTRENRVKMPDCRNCKTGFLPGLNLIPLKVIAQKLTELSTLFDRNMEQIYEDSQLLTTTQNHSALQLEPLCAFHNKFSIFYCILDENNSVVNRYHSFKKGDRMSLNVRVLAKMYTEPRAPEPIPFIGISYGLRIHGKP